MNEQETLASIKDYLGNGGLFNPEMMEHDKVRDLIVNCRTIIEQLQAKIAALREALIRASDELDGDVLHQPQTCGVLGYPLCYIHKALSPTAGNGLPQETEKSDLRKSIDRP